MHTECHSPEPRVIDRPSPPASISPHSKFTVMLVHCWLVQELLLSPI